MTDYARANAESWYHHSNGSRGRQLPNGSLYLITGWETARAWGMASFQRAAARSPFRLAFQSVLAGSTGAYKYRWTVSGPARTQTSGQIPAEDVPLNQTVFIHGYSISLGRGIWDKLFKGVEISEIADCRPGQDGNRDYIPFGTRGFSFSWSIGSTGGKQHGREDRAPTHAVEIADLAPAQNLHPSQVINNYILEKFLDAAVVMTHDDDWRDILRSDNTNQDVVSLLKRACEDFSLEEANGLITVRRSRGKSNEHDMMGSPPASPLGSELFTGTDMDHRSKELLDSASPESRSRPCHRSTSTSLDSSTGPFSKEDTEHPCPPSEPALEDDDCDKPLPPTRPPYGQLRHQEPLPSSTPFNPNYLSPHWTRNLRVDTTPELLESGWQPSQYFPASPSSPSSHSPASLAGSETSSGAPVSPGTPSYLQLPNPMIASPSRQRSTNRGGSPSPYRYRSPQPSPYDLSDSLEAYRGRSKTRVERDGMQKRFLSIEPSVNAIDSDLEALSIEETPQPDVSYPSYIHDESYMGRLIPQDFASLGRQAGYSGSSSSSLSPIPRPAAPAQLDADEVYYNGGAEHAPSFTVISDGIRKARPRRKERSPYPPQHRKAEGQGQDVDPLGPWDGQMSPEGPMTSQPIRAQVGTDATVRASTARRKDPSKIGDFICGVCGHDFMAKHNLNNHMNSHLDIKNFECGCGERFGTAHVLKRHKSKCSSES
ncbi:hypothetical protein FB45DRAFT_79126 [Roridomyces roridus]|uniref:C2H2-type domain-containing protein n=1 Tax=Roridomyces roridus TaxID=1738132 RepID=A0AAD7F8S7_9AGAR|nr:hypothetical protein FB45DRAFT_79126 [Roridomyces roridus]